MLCAKYPRSAVEPHHLVLGAGAVLGDAIVVLGTVIGALRSVPRASVASDLVAEFQTVLRGIEHSGEAALRQARPENWAGSTGNE